MDSWFVRKKWWFSILMLVYQRVYIYILVCISWGCWGVWPASPVGRARPQDHQLWRFHRAVARRACCNFNSWANGAAMGCPTVDFENGPVFTPWYKQYTPYIWVKYFVKLILLLQSHPIYIIFTPWVNWWLKYTQWYIGQSTTFFWTLTIQLFSASRISTGFLQDVLIGPPTSGSKPQEWDIPIGTFGNQNASDFHIFG